MGCLRVGGLDGFVVDLRRCADFGVDWGMFGVFEEAGN